MDNIYEPPANVEWFQKELDRASLAYPGAVRLRIVWAPAQFECRFVWQGQPRNYQKYPLLGWQTQLVHLGDYWVRGRYVIAYQKASDRLKPANVREGDFIIPHMERVHPSLHIWIIEKQLPDEYARAEWDKKVKLAEKNLGKNIFGEFPKEGRWEWFDDIARHHSGCCEMAADRNVSCRGLYREPDHGDIERVRAALEHEANLPEDRTSLIEQTARDLTKQCEDWEALARLEILQEVRECKKLDDIAQERSRVSIGVNPPIHRSRF